MVIHHLHEIDREHRTALCSVCGRTEIYVAKSRTDRTPRVFCINRWRESQEANKRRISEKQRLQPGWKPRHSLSEIDTEKMTAICSVCGLTDIWKSTEKQSTRYLCANKERTYQRKYRRNQYTSRIANPLFHTLSEIDEDNKNAVCSRCGPVQIYMWQGERKIGRRCSNASVEGVPEAQKIRREINTNLINRYKVEHGCERCGFNMNLTRLYLHSRNPDKKAPKIEKLLKLNRQDLMRELEDYEVLCGDCHHLVQLNLTVEPHTK